MSNDRRWVVKPFPLCSVSQCIRLVDKRAWVLIYHFEYKVHVLITTNLGWCIMVYCCSCFFSIFFCFFTSFLYFCSMRSEFFARSLALSWDTVSCVVSKCFLLIFFLLLLRKLNWNGLKLEFHVGRATKYVRVSVCEWMWTYRFIFLDFSHLVEHEYRLDDERECVSYEHEVKENADGTRDVSACVCMVTIHLLCSLTFVLDYFFISSYDVEMSIEQWTR